MGQIRPKNQSYLPLNKKKYAEIDLVYTLANIIQSTPNLVKMYVTIRSRMSLIIDLIRPEQSVICP